MESWAAPYLIPYLLLFFFWLLAANRQILFWLYLWQLKEYHLGRFLAHFETAKGKSLFLNPLFLAKIAILAIGLAAFADNTLLLPFGIAVFAIMGLQAVYAAYGIIRMDLLHPVITKKSLLLVVATHLPAFAAAIFVFGLFLGEMSLSDFAYAALLLLTIDILLPTWAALVILLFQPITIWQKNRILAKAAAIINQRPGLITIAISGSFGKSSTKELLAAILSQKFNVLKTPANINTEIGVARTIINDLKPEHRIFVCEIGAVHKGRIKQVASAVKPKIGILTGINQQHLGVFGSQQKIIEGKYEILEALPESGTAILNWDSRLARENFESQKSRIKAKNIILCGKDIFATDIRAGIDNLSFVVHWQSQSAPVKTNARGAFMAGPILLAISGALAASMDLEEIARILDQTDFTPFNVGVGKNSAGINIISSTYSSNPDGVMAHLDYLKLHSGKKVIVMPCLIELGRSSKEVHRQIGEKIAQACDLAIITTKDRFSELKSGALSAGMRPENIVFLDDPRKIASLLGAFLQANDTILLEGRSPRALIETITKLK